MADWWNSLSGVEQFAVMAAIVALLVLAGASFTVGIWAAGALTFLMSQGHVLATFTRNPKQATLDYLTKTPPQKIGLDLLQWGLALSPGNRFRWFGRRGIREATERYATDPDAWRVAREALPKEKLTPHSDPSKFKQKFMGHNVLMKKHFDKPPYPKWKDGAGKRFLEDSTI